MTVRELINKIIDAKILNGVSLSKKIGVPYQTLHSWKSGNCSPRKSIEAVVMPKLLAVIGERVSPVPESETVAAPVFESPREFFSVPQPKKSVFVRQVTMLIHRAEAIVDEALAETIRETADSLAYTNTRNDLKIFNKAHLEMIVIGPIVEKNS